MSCSWGDNTHRKGLNSLGQEPSTCTSCSLLCTESERSFQLGLEYEVKNFVIELISRTVSFLIMFFLVLVKWVAWSSCAPLIHALQCGISKFPSIDYVFLVLPPYEFRHETVNFNVTFLQAQSLGPRHFEIKCKRTGWSRFTKQ